MRIPSTPWRRKVYSRFRGVDFSTDATNIDESRASDALNMIADEAGFPSKRIGWRVLSELTGGKVNGLHYLPLLQGYGIIFAHVGTKLYAIPTIRKLRNVLPSSAHGDEEYFSSFRPTSDHLTWMRACIAGTATITYAWQTKNADEDEDGKVTENDLALLIVGMSLTADEPAAATDTNTSMANAPSTSFECGGNLYVLDGTHYYCIRRTKSTVQSLNFYNGYTISAVTGKIPTTGTNGYYKYEEIDDGNGGVTTDEGTWQHCTAYEEANYIESKQINTMAGDGYHDEFWLTTTAATINEIKIFDGSDWNTETDYTSETDGSRTKITFTAAPDPHPEGTGFDNIRVTFTPTTTLSSTKITHCTIAARYGFFNDNRIFLSGNPDTPNVDYMSDVDDPTYFPENGFTKIGSEYTAIKGYLHYGDVLAILKEQDNFEPEIYIRAAEEQDDGTVLYPVRQGIKGVGAASCKAFASLRDDPLFFARSGVYAICGTDASQQRTVQNRSFFIDARMSTERGEPIAAVVGDRYVLCFPNSGHCYVADAKQVAYIDGGANQYENRFVYEWYFWENIPACAFLTIGNSLYFGTPDGSLCRFNDDIEDLRRFSDGMKRTQGAWAGGEPIRAYWMTKQDALSSISQTKSLRRRGCSVMVKPYERSSILLTAEYNGILVNSTVDLFDSEITATVFPFEINPKRFTTLRMKLENNTLNEGFGVYGIQIEYVEDRYVK